MNFPNCAPICGEYRGEFLDIIKFGHFCVIDENDKVVMSMGDPCARVFYRSAAKPLQALPTLVRKLPEKYGLTERETAILAASHKGEPFHVEVLESIMQKTGILEKDMIMLPDAPVNPFDYDGNKRKIYHNCSGKHLSLMLLQRDLTGDVKGYHLPDSPAQTEVKRVLALLSGCTPSGLDVAIDGCGVPVYAVEMRQMAHAFCRMACPDLIADRMFADAAAHLKHCINQNPEMLRGSNSTSLYINGDANLIGKSGANGLFCIGMKKERLGIAIKMIDGTSDWFPLAIYGILSKLGYQNQTLFDQLLSKKPTSVINDCGETVGRREFFF